MHRLLQFVPDPRFEEVKKFVRSGAFGAHNYDELIGSLEGNEGFGRADYFLVGKDFPSYIECQERVDKAYRDRKVSGTTTRQVVCFHLIITNSGNMKRVVIYLAEMDEDVDIEYGGFVQVQQR